MKIKLGREPCCGADDQGPNPTNIEIECLANVSPSQLAAQIIEMKFLQFSSTHDYIIGYSSEKPIFGIYGDLTKPPAFFVPENIYVASVLISGRLEFKWQKPKFYKSSF